MKEKSKQTICTTENRKPFIYFVISLNCFNDFLDGNQRNYVRFLLFPKSNFIQKNVQIYLELILRV